MRKGIDAAAGSYGINIPRGQGSGGDLTVAYNDEIVYDENYAARQASNASQGQNLLPIIIGGVIVMYLMKMRR